MLTSYQATHLIRTVIIPLMITVGLILNTISFAVMKQIKSTTATYMTYLSLVDSGVLSVGLVSLWLHSASHNSLPIITEIGCKIVPFMFYSLADFSVLIILIMTGERFYGVWKPLSNSKINKNRRLKINLLIGLAFSLLVNSHFTFTHSLVNVGDKDQRNSTLEKDDLIETSNLCEYVIWKEFYEIYWTFIDASLYSFMPFLVITTLNILIIVTLRKAERVESITRHKSKKSISKIIEEDKFEKSDESKTKRVSLIRNNLKPKKSLLSYSVI